MNERVSFELYRLTVINSWPDGEVKGAALASARAALQREMAFTKIRPGETVNSSWDSAIEAERGAALAGQLALRRTAIAGATSS